MDLPHVDFGAGMPDIPEAAGGIGPGSVGPVPGPAASPRGAAPIGLASGEGPSSSHSQIPGAGLDPDKPWVLVRHHAWQGEQALYGLRAAGFPSHWPRYYHRERRKDTQNRPIFQPYLFAQCDPARDPWGLIREVGGVQHIVGVKTRGTPWPVRPQVVLDLIRAAGGIDGIIDLFPVAAARPALRPGTPMLVREGHHLAGRIVRFKRPEAGERLRALAEVMGVQAEILLREDQVEALS